MSERRTGRERLRDCGRMLDTAARLWEDGASHEEVAAAQSAHDVARDAIASDLDALAAAREAAVNAITWCEAALREIDADDPTPTQQNAWDALAALRAALDGKREGT